MADRTERWHPTACILCECNCGIEVRLGADGRTFERIRGDKAHPASRGTRREGAAPGPLPERPPPADDTDAAPARRHLRARRLGHRHRRGGRRVRPRPGHPRWADDLLLRRWRAREPPQPRVLGGPARPREPLPVQRAGPGEDRRVLGVQRDRVLHPAATWRAPRWRCSSARTPGSPTASPRARACSRRSPTIRSGRWSCSTPAGPRRPNWPTSTSPCARAPTPGASPPSPP